MIRDSQRNDWQALVDYLRPQGNGACLNSLLEEGPDDMTDFKGLLEKFKRMSPPKPPRQLTFGGLLSASLFSMKSCKKCGEPANVEFTCRICGCVINKN